MRRMVTTKDLLSLNKFDLNNNVLSINGLKASPVNADGDYDFAIKNALNAPLLNVYHYAEDVNAYYMTLGGSDTAVKCNGNKLELSGSEGCSLQYDGDDMLKVVSGEVYINPDGEDLVYIKANSDDGVSIYAENGTVNLTADNSLNLEGVTINVILDGGNIVFEGLPTSAPEVEGALWNDNGVLKISAGE